MADKLPAPFGYETEYAYMRVNGVIQSVLVGRKPIKHQHAFLSADASAVCSRCGNDVDDEASHGDWQRQLTNPTPEYKTEE